MRSILFCLVLWSTAPVWANSLENTVCAKGPASVQEMAASQKLCRSFVMALEKSPGAMTEEVLALLTPENLAFMGTLTSVWMGSQGVPAVGQTVDAALLTLGVVLLASQAADLSNALWQYTHKTLGAQTRAELEAAASHLARAIALAGVNVVTFILTKKVAGRVKRTPPAEPPGMSATPPGTPHLENPVQVYTWHHHQDVGRMQLVPFEAHRLAMPHTGGMAIWGGGHR